MYGSGAIGFFGKLPCAGDFVQRRLSRSFVETWDASFEHGVAESKAMLGGGWQEAYRSSPVWRFVLAPGVCSDNAWAGVMGPGADRVGRCFPMVIAAELAAEYSACADALAHGSWFDSAGRLLASAQNDARHSIDAFDADVAALAGLVSAHDAETDESLLGNDWSSAAQWRLPMPNTAVSSQRYLAKIWSQLGTGKWCLWWTEGGGHVPASVLVTTNLPAPGAYAGFLDATHVGSWRSVGRFAAPPVGADVHPAAIPISPAPRQHEFAPIVSPASAFDSDITQPMKVAPLRTDTPPRNTMHSAVDLSDLLPPTPIAAPTASAAAFKPILRREDCALTLVAVEGNVSGGTRQRTAGAVLALAREMEPADFSAGLQALRDRLLQLHAKLGAASGDLLNPVSESCSVAGARVQGAQVSVLRFGAASAWRWRRGQLQALFALDSLAPAADNSASGDELDDLLFATAIPNDGGLGAAGTPAWDESSCSVQPGDRVMLATTRQMVQIPPDVMLRGLAMRTCEEASARIAASAGLTSDPQSWPFAVIEIPA